MTDKPNPQAAAIDLDALAADLEAAGWTIEYASGVLVNAANATRCLSAYSSGDIDAWDEESDTSCIRVTDPIWQEAIRLIFRHTADAATASTEGE